MLFRLIVLTNNKEHSCERMKIGFVRYYQNNKIKNYIIEMYMKTSS